MVTIKEFKEWLDRFPEETIIEVGIQESPTLHDNYGCVNFKTPELEGNDSGSGWEFFDFRSNKLIKESSPYFGKCYLQLGEAS